MSRYAILTAGLVSFALAAGPAFAQAFPPLVRKPILEAQLPAGAQVTVVKGATIRFAPGQPTGLHQHPMATVGIVTQGAFDFQPQGQPLQHLKTGDAFYEPANHTILKFDNASKTAPGEISVFYLAPDASMPLIKPLDGK